MSGMVELLQMVEQACRGIPYHNRDEAYSEGLVILAEALNDFDATRGVPLQPFVYKRLQWKLANWSRKEIRQKAIPELLQASRPKLTASLDGWLDWLCVVERAKSRLTPWQYDLFLDMVQGAYMKELSKKHKMIGPDIKREMDKVRAKLIA